ncbi:hypothetical protein AS594_00220 [Streptomyces agglomeratus]|uniref:DUF721 domain-containing protein n=1 Tax=Streptomyces agglomeratus TaxID=285458 RepID=A0A1E5P0V6_9ACTN|nr:DciA family protein [Streptomyces agglomeratus]OEJ23183.1 hypothetical protein AS594_00220 [Streptomyces agglomeratus]OEJ55288.1 hypothetical protein BGK72_35515 [Streptomyces agglomeratus]
MDFERPDWFDRATEWWCSTVGNDLARHAQPVGISSDGELGVLCSDQAWSTQMRLMAHRVVERLNGARPDDLPKVAGITVLKPAPVPEELIQLWSDLVGSDLADRVRPRSLSDWGRELATEAECAHARDLLAQRTPFVLARLRATLPGSSIVRLRTSHLRSVGVLIASSPEFSDRAAVEGASP